jgi:excisionase family DNA binding protein
MKEIYITVSEAARDQGVSKVTIHKYIQQGKLKSIFDKVQGKYLIELASLKEFAKNRYVELNQDE